MGDRKGRVERERERDRDRDRERERERKRRAEMVSGIPQEASALTCLSSFCRIRLEPPPSVALKRQESTPEQISHAGYFEERER